MRSLTLRIRSGLNPYGIASLAERPMKTQQAYDVSVTMSLPRSPPNIERGNFMVKLLFLDKDFETPTTPNAGILPTAAEQQTALFQARRPALIPYEDPAVSLASRLIFLLYHVFFSESRTCTMTVPLAEGMMANKGAEIPSSVYLEVEAGQAFQIYSVEVTLTAQLQGLRYLMVHYRLPMYVALTTIFWCCEVVFMVMAWGILGSLFGMPTNEASPSGPNGKAMRSLGGVSKELEFEQDGHEDGEDMRDSSDRPLSFPSIRGQPALKHEPRVKQELTPDRALAEIPAGDAEADDEDDEFDEGQDDRWKGDSGLGTSYSEEGSTSVRRRMKQESR
jgi:seipin